MKRTDEFRKFVSTRHSSAESIYCIPEIPGNCDLDFVEKVADEIPIAENPYEKSDLRKNGLKIWDSAYIPVPKSVSLDIKRPKDIGSLRSINGEWETTKGLLSLVGKPDGVHYLRPKGQYILDLMNDDIRILQGAHIITHREPVLLDEDEFSFGQLSDIFLRNVIKLFLARKYGLLMNMHPEKECEDSFTRYGIEIFGSPALRAPVMMAATSGPQCRLTVDKTVVTVLGSVGIEAHPSQAATSTDWKETNKWSCLPTLVALVGWECVDYVTHAERVELNGTPYYAIPGSDLQGMDSFEEFISTAMEAKGIPDKSHEIFNVNEWFDSPDFASGLSVTPQLPCPHCIRLNRGAPGVISRPRTKKPRRKLKELKNSNIPELKDWYSYVTFINNCITIGRTATAYALGSVTSVTRRNSEFKRRCKKLKRISSLTDKYRSKLSSGFISEAEEIAIKINEIKETL